MTRPMPLRRLLAAPALALLLVSGCGDDSGGPAAPVRPEGVQAPGVYRYATEGFERVGGPLPGRHRFGPTSTVTVDLSGCEVVERWDAIPERWAEWTYCVTGGTWRLRSVTDQHEFFGQVESYSYRCSGRAVPRPARIETGFRWTDRCRARGTVAVARGEVVSIGPIAAGGRRVEAVRLRIRTTLSGRARGAYTMESWLRRTDGLLLRRALDSRTLVRSSVGNVPARERYAMRIRSLEPDSR